MSKADDRGEGPGRPPRAAARMRRRACAAAVLAAALPLAACLSNAVESLGPDRVRLTLRPQDAPSEQGVLRAVLRLAAQETLARGYELFRLAENSARLAAAGAGDTERPNLSVVVVMFRRGDPAASGVFDARRILEMQEPPG